jgi:hypothetical protein
MVMVPDAVQRRLSHMLFQFEVGTPNFLPSLCVCDLIVGV